MILWICGMSLYITLGYSYQFLEAPPNFSDFIRGLTTAISISLAIIVFVLTSILRDYRDRITRHRVIPYLFGIFGSLCLLLLSYTSMIKGEFQDSISTILIAFIVVLGVLGDLLVFYHHIMLESESNA